MTDKEAIERLKGRYVTVSMCLTESEARAENEAIDMAIAAIRERAGRKCCKTCKWIGSYWGDCTCDESKYHGHLMRPGDKCDQWEEKSRL